MSAASDDDPSVLGGEDEEEAEEDVGPTQYLTCWKNLLGFFHTHLPFPRSFTLARSRGRANLHRLEP